MLCHLLQLYIASAAVNAGLGGPWADTAARIGALEKLKAVRLNRSPCDMNIKSIEAGTSMHGTSARRE